MRRSTLLARLGLIARRPGPSGPGTASGSARIRCTSRRIGEQVQRLPLHPRLARMLVAAGGARRGRAGVRAAVGAALCCRRERRRRRPICCRRSTLAARCRRTCSAWRRRLRISADCVRMLIPDRTESAIGNPRSLRCRGTFPPRDPGRLPRSRRAAPRAGIAECPAGVRHRRDDRAGERRARRRVPGRARRCMHAQAPRPRDQRSVRSAGRPPTAVERCPAFASPAVVEREWLAADRRPTSSTASTKRKPVRVKAVRSSVRRARSRRASRCRRSRRRGAAPRRRVARAAVRATTTPGCCGACDSRVTTWTSTMLVRSAARLGVARSTMCSLMRALPPDVLSELRSRRARVAAGAERPPRAPRVRTTMARFGVGEAAGSVRARRNAAHRPAPRAGACWRYSRRTGARCSSRAICAASGTARTRK